MSRFAVAVLFLLFGCYAEAQVRQGAWTPVAETMERGYTSISYWTYREDGVEIGGGRISIEHGLPDWPSQLGDDEAFDAATRGKIWRLGNNKWTTLDTQLALQFGAQSVDAGIYYLGLERKTSGDWTLVFVDPEAVRPLLIDAWAFVPRATEVPVLFRAPLQHQKTAQIEGRLTVELGLEEGSPSSGRLEIRWGPHRLRSSFRIEMVRPDFYKGSGPGR